MLQQIIFRTGMIQQKIGWSVRSWWISVKSVATVVVTALILMKGMTLESPNEELKAGGAWMLSNAGV